MLIDAYGEEIIKAMNAILNRTEERSCHKEAENEVCYKIWKSIDQFDPSKSSLKTWLLTINRNSYIDKKRSIRCIFFCRSSLSHSRMNLRQMKKSSPTYL